MVILTTQMYEDIVKVIINSKSLLSSEIDKCLTLSYPELPKGTICTIVAQVEKENIRNVHHRIVGMAKKLLGEYDQAMAKKSDHFYLVTRSKRLQFPPIPLARILLTERFKNEYTKFQIAEMIRNPNLIDDPILACNIANCMKNDCYNGPITDVVTRCIGEEFEIRLKEMAREAGLIFYDENDLRRTGFDKTPDLKLAVPIMFRGKVIHWIESKALFGSLKIHKKYIKEQLSSYYNRAGIVIYWEGYQDVVAYTEDNKNLIVVTDSFPKKEEITLLDFK